jgi:hypothetical protein
MPNVIPKPNRLQVARRRRRRKLEEQLIATADKLVTLYESRFGLDGINYIFLEREWLCARYVDDSEGSLLQYRVRP